MGTVRQSLSRLYTQLLLSCLKPKVGNSTHSDGRNARESLSNVWLPNLLLFKIKKEINKFEESISTQSHLAYNVLNLTGNWECCFLKRRGETGLPRKKPLRDSHVVSPTGFTNPSHTGGGWGGMSMPSPLHPSIFQRYWIILTCVATISFDPHGNVTTPSPRDNAQESTSDWRVKRVHDNCIAIPIPGEILCKQVKLLIRTGYLNQ